jgi:uncharacterized oxidoreductase
MPKFAHADLLAFGERVLGAAGVPPADASLFARLLVKADLRGYTGHGLSHVHSYIERMSNGLIRLENRAEVVREGKTTAVVDGHFYIGQVVAHGAMKLAIEKAAEHGVGIVCVRQSGHVGRAADYVEMAADRGMIGMATVSTGGGNIAPYGGMEPIAGTNPMAFGIPGKDGQHIILDFATSSMSMGELNHRVAMNEPLPEGILLDGYGNPTTEFSTFRGPPRGVMLPFGGHKGSGVHIVADVLAGVLSGNGRGMTWLDKGASAVNAVFLQAISVEELLPLDEFTAQIAEFASFIRTRKPAPGFDEVRVPGDRSREMAERQMREGVEMRDDLWRHLVETAERMGVTEIPQPVEAASKGSPTAPQF